MSQAATKAPPQASALWTFSIDLYRAPGFSDACIRLQDDAGADVNLVFFLLWNAALKRKLSTAEVAAVDRAVADWRETAVIPMRRIRRALKDAPLLPDPNVLEDYRTRIKGLELEAERLEHEALSDFFQERSPGQLVASGTEAARANIAAYEDHLATHFAKEPVDTIVAAFAAKHG
jgi:uncharacterized protein (TIGR02444 family)